MWRKRIPKLKLPVILVLSLLTFIYFSTRNFPAVAHISSLPCFRSGYLQHNNKRGDFVWSKRLRKHPCAMGLDLPVIILMNFNFLEPMALIELFGPIVGNLYMEVDSIDFGLLMGLRGFQD